MSKANDLTESNHGNSTELQRVHPPGRKGQEIQRVPPSGRETFSVFDSTAVYPVVNADAVAFVWVDKPLGLLRVDPSISFQHQSKRGAGDCLLPDRMARSLRVICPERGPAIVAALGQGRDRESLVIQVGHIGWPFEASFNGESSAGAVASID